RARAVDGATQRCLVAWVDHDGRRGRHGPDGRDQAIVFAGRLRLRRVGRHGAAPNSANLRYDAFALGSKGATFDSPSSPTPKSSATCFKRFARSPVMSALADSTSRIAARAPRR